VKVRGKRLAGGESGNECTTRQKMYYGLLPLGVLEDQVLLADPVRPARTLGLIGILALNLSR
jgi:hypothetical protein